MPARKSINAFNKRVAAARADLEAGRNLPEAVSIFHWTKNKNVINKFVKFYAAAAKARRRQGETVTHPDLGLLTHDGADFVGKCRSSLYPRNSVELLVGGQLPEPTVARVWRNFRKRERKLKGELERAISERYAVLRQSSSELRPLKRASDIWKTLGPPSIQIQRAGKRPSICIRWSPQWDPEHGVAIHLASDATIEQVE